MLPMPRPPLLVPLSPGELLDKITILEIKQARLADAGQRANVAVELAMLRQIWTGARIELAELPVLTAELQAINEQLWEAIDALRRHERDGDFGHAFIARARSVYHLNDRRAHLKNRLNELCNSLLREEKSYCGSPDTGASSAR